MEEVNMIVYKSPKAQRNLEAKARARAERLARRGKLPTKYVCPVKTKPRELAWLEYKKSGVRYE